MYVISFTEANNILEKKVFEWGVSEQKRMGCIAEPISLHFDSDFLTTDKDHCIVSVFHDKDSGKTLLRRDWLDDMGIKYNILVNFEEIKKVAPKSAAHMLRNGVKLFRYYDGPHGGITRRIDKAWN